MKQGIIGEVTLGLGSAYVPKKKEFIGAIIGAVGGIASGLIGGAASAAAARRAESKQRADEAKEAAYYNRRYNEDYVDTAAGQNLVRRANDIYKKQVKQAVGAEAVGGGTNAATQMAKDSANRAVGETIADMAAQDTARKERADEQHRAAESRFAAMDMQREMTKGDNVAQVAAMASNAIMQGASAIEGSSSLKGGSNNGTSVEKPASGSVTSVSTSAPAPSVSTQTFGGNNSIESNSSNVTPEQRLAARRIIGGV